MRYVFGALAVCLVASPLPADEAAVKKELEKLQGTWLVKVIETKGQKDDATGMEVTFKGEKYVQRLGVRVLETGTIKIDPAKKPKTIDFIIAEGPMKGMTQKSIYELDGDILKVNAPGGEGTPRPKDFATQPDSQDVVFTFKRISKD